MEVERSAAPIEVNPNGNECQGSEKIRYMAPTLRAMGDVRTVTLGSSPGATESSGGSVSRKPAGT